jgi:glycosyltransferase involved in cell wall biosynthesis
MIDNKVGIILLVYNEEIHLKRCLENLLLLTSNIYVVDSYSTDNTLDILNEYGIVYVQNKFSNHSNQVNFAIKNFPFKTNYILRIDSDELLSLELIKEIKTSKLLDSNSEISGFYIKRKVKFLNKILNYGNINPIWLLRLWKIGKGVCDDKLMDEKIIVSDQKTAKLQNIIIDNNLNNLTWWTHKHNNYSNREALEILNKKYLISKNSFKGDYYSIDFILFLLKSFYNKMPIFLRSFLLFFYSYFLKLGILDGIPGFIWNVLQVFWYRYLVDVKVYEFEYLNGFDKVKIKAELKKLDEI